MKEFNLELAKAGHPVQTRDGRAVRILCYDRKSNLDMYPIVALVPIEDREEAIYYTEKGVYSKNSETSLDLFMIPNKKEGWVNIYPNECNSIGLALTSNVYKTEEEALAHKSENCIATTKIEWE